MSIDNKNSVMDDLNASLKESVDYEKKKNEVAKANINNRYDIVKREEEETRQIDSISVDLQVNEEEVKYLQDKVVDDLRNAKNSGVFICDAFKGMVPFFGGQVTLCLAKTGGGKSTATANIIYNAARQGQRVLVISNEETAGDIYNRVTALIKGIPYTNLENFTEEQIQTFKKYIPILMSRVKVISNDSANSLDFTTSFEGIETIFTKVLEGNVKYDVIVIDYYQNISRSTKNSGLGPYEVQDMFSKLLNTFKERPKCPIVLMAQKKGRPESELSDWKQDIEGRKTIGNVAACVLDFTADPENLKTIVTCKKSRFNGAIGKTIELAYDMGRYKTYTDDFRNKVVMRKERKEHSERIKKIKMEE